MFQVPILLINFNRPRHTQRIVDALRPLKPSMLYVAIDGPRSDRPEDKGLVQQVAAVINNQINWPCEVRKLVRAENLGCREGVSSAISWFFNSENEGIILEDDCLPKEVFFAFCKDLLERHRNDDRVMHITGFNRFPERRPVQSYFFSKNPGVWGWASWRRAWRLYDKDLGLLEDAIQSGRILAMYPNPVERMYKLKKLRQIKSNNLDTWDYQWEFSIRVHNGLAIKPNKNLIQNIGLDSEATHTSNKEFLGKAPVSALEFPLEPPKSLRQDRAKDLQHFFKSILLGVVAKMKKNVGL